MKTFLTAEESRVAELVADGCMPRVVATELGKSAKTVRVQLTRVYRKLGILASNAESSCMRLAIYWHCELFQIGLTEMAAIEQERAYFADALKTLDFQKSIYGNCELFQTGLEELGLA